MGSRPAGSLCRVRACPQLAAPASEAKAPARLCLSTVPVPATHEIFQLPNVPAAQCVFHAHLSLAAPRYRGRRYGGGTHAERLPNTRPALPPSFPYFCL